MQVKSGTSFAKADGNWFRYEVEVSDSDFPPGTYDKLTGFELWRALSTVGELYVRLEVVRQKVQPADVDRITLLKAELASKGLPL